MLSIVNDRGRIIIGTDEDYIGPNVKAEVVEFVKLAWQERILPLYEARNAIDKLENRKAWVMAYRPIQEESHKIAVEAAELNR